jgi:hypothetical protein
MTTPRLASCEARATALTASCEARAARLEAWVIAPVPGALLALSLANRLEARAARIAARAAR